MKPTNINHYTGIALFSPHFSRLESIRCLCIGAPNDGNQHKLCARTLCMSCWKISIIQPALCISTLTTTTTRLPACLPARLGLQFKWNGCWIRQGWIASSMFFIRVVCSEQLSMACMQCYTHAMPPCDVKPGQASAMGQKRELRSRLCVHIKFNHPFLINCIK